MTLREQLEKKKDYEGRDRYIKMLISLVCELDEALRDASIENDHEFIIAEARAKVQELVGGVR